MSNTPAPLALLSRSFPDISTINLRNMCRTSLPQTCYATCKGWWPSTPSQAGRAGVILQGPSSLQALSDFSTVISLSSLPTVCYTSQVLCEIQEDCKGPYLMRSLRNKIKREFAFLPVRQFKLRLIGTTQH